MKREMKKLAYALENTQIKAEKLHSLHGALEAAIFEQDTFAISDFEWAHCLMGDLTHELKTELNELKNYAFDSFKKGGEVNG